MALETRSPTILRFGTFEVDVRAGELRKQGKRIKLQDQPFQVLSVLLRRPGEVSTREELRSEIWAKDTFVDFENSLNTAISKLREALEDSADNPRFIETLPRRGYRFIGPVSTDHQRKSPIPATKRKITVAVAIVLLGGLAAGFITFLLLSSTRDPRIIGIIQITHSGRVDPWRRMVSDGSRIYFLEREGDRWNLMQTSVEGGEPQIVASPFRSTLPLDISPDRSEFLIASFTAPEGLMPLWIWPVQGGAPRRVGEVMAYDAVWFGGRQIMYAKNDGIYAIEKDGASSRLIVSTGGRPSMFAWSPDRRRLRFTVDNDEFRSSAIWEMDVDGRHLHRLFPGWSDPPLEDSGVWSPDARYFFFHAYRGGSTELWATQEKGSLLHRRQVGPVRLTAGPEQFAHPIAARGKLLAFGLNNKTELVRYDPSSRQFATLLANQHPWGATYSRDGQWIVYIAPDGSLRTIKANGTEELSLTAPPLMTDAPAWSPDGKQVAFRGHTRVDQVWKLYVASAQGGTPREVLPSEREQGNPAWSPDGRFLAFGQEEWATSGTSGRVSIQVLNIEANQASQLPDSQGRTFPSWSPDGHFLAALSGDEHKLMLFDLRTQGWSQVSEGNFIAGGLFWSGDSRFLYFQDLLAPNEPVYRLGMDNRRVERVASFEVFLQGGVPRCGFQGLTPDGALLVVLLRNHADIYALSLDLP